MKYEWVPWLINTCMLVATLFVAFTTHRWRKERASKQELEALKAKIEDVEKKSSKDRNSIPIVLFTMLFQRHSPLPMMLCLRQHSTVKFEPLTARMANFCGSSAPQSHLKQ